MGKVVLFGIALFICSCNHRKQNILIDVKQLENYPSASGIEYFYDKYYVIGDDANSMIILDSGLQIVDSIRFYSFAEKRIPKEVKADLESITTLSDGKLLILGSGSLSPYRNTGWFIDPVTKQTDSLRLDTLYQRLKANYLPQVNIEGVTAIPGFILMANRGNKGQPKNHLVFAPKDFWIDQSYCKITTALIGPGGDSTNFAGISGLDYSNRSDRLLITVSTENTSSATKDGAIGKSYLWIVNNFSTKKKWKAINPDKVIDLDDLDSRFKGHKIESACILSERGAELKLLLAADDDNGNSTLFTVLVYNK
jgi:hypothetical protein